jgi:hypothetical protein
MINYTRKKQKECTFDASTSKSINDAAKIQSQDFFILPEVEAYQIKEDQDQSQQGNINTSNTPLALSLPLSSHQHRRNLWRIHGKCCYASTRSFPYTIWVEMAFTTVR